MVVLLPLVAVAMVVILLVVVLLNCNLLLLLIEGWSAGTFKVTISILKGQMIVVGRYQARIMRPKETILQQQLVGIWMLEIHLAH